MLRKAVIRFFINAAALWLADYLFTGVKFDTTESLLIAALVFGLLNTFIKPILVVLTLPINILTLGLFTVIINAIILGLTAYLIDSFHLSGYITTIFAALFISIVSVILNMLLKDKK